MPHAHNDVIRRITSEHHGTLVKSQGDGSMLAFPSARRALTCAIAIDRALIETFTDPGHRSACASACTWASPSVRRTDFFGHTVNYAVRVASSARGGEIVVSSLVYDLPAQTGEFAFGDARHVELKGIDGTQVVYPLAIASSGPASAG